MEDISILGDSFKQAIQARDLEVIPTSVNEFNDELLMIGGLPRGRAIEVYATPSNGKTSFCQWLVKELQAKGLKCAWADVEGTFHKPYAQSAGVDLDKLYLIDFGHGEDLLYKLKLAVASNFFDLIVVDSINAIVPGKISESKIEDLNMNEKLEAARMLSQFFKSLDGGYSIKSPKDGKLIKSNIITKTINEKTLKEETDPHWHKLVQKKTVLVFINHKLDKVGVTFGKKTYTPGGSRKNFSFSLQLNLRVVETKTKKSQGKEVLSYKRIEIKTDKNKVGEPIRTLYLDLYPNGVFKFSGFKRKSEEIEEEIESVEEEQDITNPFRALKEKLDERSSD